MDINEAKELMSLLEDFAKRLQVVEHEESQKVRIELIDLKKSIAKAIENGKYPHTSHKIYTIPQPN